LPPLFIIERNFEDKKFVSQWVLGFDELKRHVLDKAYTPVWAEKITGVPAAKIRHVAESYAKAKPAAIFCNAGISHQLNAFDTYRTLVLAPGTSTIRRGIKLPSRSTRQMRGNAF